MVYHCVRRPETLNLEDLYLCISQDRKDKEKDKRARGQSSIGAWKSEAEMVLRQQYD